MDEKTTPKPEAKAKAVEAEVAPETKPEPIVIKAESAKAPEPVAPAPEPEKVEEPKAPEPALPIEPPSAPEPAPEPPKAPEPAKLFSVKTDAYSAWVTQNGDKSYLANLELTGGSAYNWPAGSASEAEALLKYHIANQKL
jgi:hypothetical protein